MEPRGCKTMATGRKLAAPEPRENKEDRRPRSVTLFAASLGRREPPLTSTYTGERLAGFMRAVLPSTRTSTTARRSSRSDARDERQYGDKGDGRNGRSSVRGHP
jgi:hypothetical protein